MTIPYKYYKQFSIDTQMEQSSFTQKTIDISQSQPNLAEFGGYAKVKEELADAIETIMQKEKLIDIQKRTIDNLNRQNKSQSARIQLLEEKSKKDSNPEVNTLKNSSEEKNQQHSISNSRGLQNLMLELDQEKSKSQKLAKQLQGFKTKTQEYESQKLKYEIQIQNLTNQLKNVTRNRRSQLQRQTEDDKKLHNQEASLLPTQINSQSLFAPQGHYAPQNQQSPESKESTSNEDKYDEDESIKIFKTNQEVMVFVSAHLLKLSQPEKSSFFSMIGMWSQEMLDTQFRKERRETALDQLYDL